MARHVHAACICEYCGESVTSHGGQVRRCATNDPRQSRDLRHARLAACDSDRECEQAQRWWTRHLHAPCAPSHAPFLVCAYSTLLVRGPPFEAHARCVVLECVPSWAQLAARGAARPRGSRG